MTAAGRPTRAGFTLIEVMIVIAIIAVLAGLLLTGISRARGAGRRVQAANDIQQLDAVTTKFKQDFGFYPPSHVSTTAGLARFKIPAFLPGTSGSDLPSEASYQVLRRMFPRWDPETLATNAGTNQVLALQTVWDPMQGKGVQKALPLPGAGKSFDPNQSMVYFLSGPSGRGFDTAAPTEIPESVGPGQFGSSKKGPYFDFPDARLVPDGTTLIKRFIDPWATPYAYFTANGDNYDARTAFPWPNNTDPAPPSYNGLAANNFSNDPNKVTTFTAHPYGSNGKWMNPGKCQIISAGPDRLFGPGSFIEATTSTLVHVWDSKNPQGNASSAVYYGEGGGSTTDPNQLARGADDMANFNEGSALGTSNAP